MTPDETEITSPLGALRLLAHPEGLTEILFLGGVQAQPSNCPSDLLVEASAQLAAYFAGDRREFDLPLALQGTDFQREVWAELQRIPFGVTISYGTLARRIDRPRAVRAVGLANGRNPLPIVIPCHRVIGADGSLTGFSSGLELKQRLLEHEGVLFAL